MSEVFERDSFAWSYAKWHYGQGLSELFLVAGNFLWFITNFFSFKLLLKTLFAPWRRLNENYGGGINLGAFFSTLIVNTLMRAFGFVTRIVVLIVGFVAYIAVFVFSFFIFIIWVLTPAILLGSIILSVTFFIL
jgi:hypothetical protein